MHALRERWRELPDFARNATGAAIVGGAIGLLFHNVVAAIGLAAILSVTVFCWTLMPSHGRLGLAALLLCVAWASASARVLVVDPLPDPTDPDGYVAHHFNCGAVLNHPISNSERAWRTEQARQLATKMRTVTDATIGEDCATQVRGYRLWAFISGGLGIAVVAWLGSDMRRASTTGAT